MDNEKRRRLERAGWHLGDAGEFLGLTPEEAAFVTTKLALARSLRETRKRLALTQVGLAKRIESSQSRVAKMEAGDPSVSIDLLVRALLALGITRRELGEVIASAE